MVDFLMGLHFGKLLRADSIIGPIQIPILWSGLPNNFETQHAMNYFFDNWILRVWVMKLVPIRFATRKLDIFFFLDFLLDSWLDS